MMINALTSANKALPYMQNVKKTKITRKRIIRQSYGAACKMKKKRRRHPTNRSAKIRKNTPTCYLIFWFITFYAQNKTFTKTSGASFFFWNVNPSPLLLHTAMSICAIMFHGNDMKAYSWNMEWWKVFSCICALREAKNVGCHFVPSSSVSQFYGQCQ